MGSVLGAREMRHAINAGETYDTKLMEADRATSSVSKPGPSKNQVLHTGHQINLGIYNANEVQICLMGSWGPE